MVKFTSWFKDRSTQLSDSSKETSGLPPGNHEDEFSESSKESKPPTKVEKVKQLLHQVGSVSSEILKKLPGSNKPIYRRYWIWATLGVSGGIIATSYTIWSIDRGLPNKTELNVVSREQTLTIKAADGSILQQRGDATREQLQLKTIPKQLQQAFIASEDRRFDKHQGVDAYGIVRAVLSNLRSQDVVEGGSTITQQLARILFLKQERTFWRKLKEVRLAQKMERELTKEQILERYLNLVYLGSGAYGVADAAWVYFSKPVNKLTLGEMATIAGLAPAPSRYSPEVNKLAAKQRRNLVLQRMLEDGFITAAEKIAATSEPITLKSSLPKRLQVEAPYFTTYVQKELPKYVSSEVIADGGLIVETSLNPKWQKAAEDAVAKVLRNEGRWENFKQAAIVAIDPRNGEVQAMVGGKDFGKNQFNRVTQAQRQPGSTFKGFVYATAIAAGKSPYDSYLDAPFIVDGYEPKNFSEKFYGWMNMRDALTRSINVVAVKVLIDIGFEPTIKIAHDMGIKSQLNRNYSLALGSNEVNLLELTSAYGSFATNGLHAEPHGIRRIINRQGKVIWSANFKPKRAIDAESAAIMTWMLRNVVTSGTGRAAQLGRPVAGKTGTSDEARDLWFVGYIPQLVTGVWLGNDNNNPTWGSSGSAAQTWHEFMEEAIKGMPAEKFATLPKLEGRKGIIKAQRVKTRRIVNRAISSYSQDDTSDEESTSRRSYRRRYRQDNSDDDSVSTTRRRRSRRYNYQEQQQEETPRYSRRRRYSQQQEEDSTPRRRRYSQQQQEDSTPRRRYRRRQTEESNSSIRESSSSYRSRRRYRQESNSDSETVRYRRRISPSSSGSNSNSSTQSWRERLRPSTPSSGAGE
ncbi:PBP1A family penicillin-binding protein [Iningainema tapete]|uniref:Penicillin-binding protein 1A n=1 Tax=Iningainema tapete BLCC-T55 TaxID=2748662 RepID=A0A8J6XHF6_9CYAN|nr:penicillin-binding protein 1A [Iningainema tapete BLCC-T55]